MIVLSNVLINLLVCGSWPYSTVFTEPSELWAHCAIPAPRYQIPRLHVLKACATGSRFNVVAFEFNSSSSNFHIIAVVAILAAIYCLYS